MIIDFGVIKSVVGTWIDSHWDHTGILFKGDDSPIVPELVEENARLGKPIYLLDNPPTAEYIARELGRIAQGLLTDYSIRVSPVRVFETPNGYATWTAPAEAGC